MLIFCMIAEEQAKVKSDAGIAKMDEAIISRIAEGDREALATLYYRTREAVFGFALSVLRNRANAEDVLQDTYIKIWHNAKNYKAQGKPMAWIITITRNLSVSKLRLYRNRDVPFDEQIQSAAATSDCISSRIDRLVLQMVLENLSEEERQIVMLHGLSGLKHREIAEILHLPLSTVLSKYRRALLKLKSALKEDD